MSGKAVGLVTTVQVTHATPAAFSAHVPSRSMTEAIALQLLSTGVDVILGGGEDAFLPNSTNGCYPGSGKRTDGRDLIEEAVSSGYTYVCDADGFSALNTDETTRLIGLFADGGLQRPYTPPLEQMTEMAIAILSQDPDGFFLMVEGGQIDWACHAQDAENAIGDTLGFDQTVAQAIEFAQSELRTLVIVSGDHETGGMSVTEIPSGLPGEDGPFTMPDGRQFYVNWTTDSHTAALIPVSAQGPAADLVIGEFENTYIYDIMFTSDGFADFNRVFLPLSLHSYETFPNKIY
jgi:alkaline phosphatase